MQRFAAALVLLAPLAAAQAPAKPSPTLTFEVASLKPSAPDGRQGGIRPSPGGERYEANAVSLRLMMQVAYRLKAEQIVGGPGWMDTELFDLNAKAEKPSNVEELHVMLQNLIAERFKVQSHRSTKEMPMYALVVDKGGPRMQAHPAASAGDPWIDQAQGQPFHVDLTATFVPMDYLAWRLSLLVDLPVVDRTELKGEYDFKLAYTRDLPPNLAPGALLNGQPIDPTGPSIFEAVRQQLGLKLERTKGPVEIIAIDHVERPSGN